MVEVTLSKLVIDENRQEQLVVLKEVDGSRSVPIVIGFMEASSIKIKLSDVDPVRPLTHDLFVTMMTYLDADLDRLVIDDLSEGTYYAKLFIINQDDEEIAIDCRPSDGIAIALRMESPIFVESDIFEKSVSLGE